MRTRLLSIAAGLLILAATLGLALRPAGPLPPVGPLLDPVNGIWTVARAARPFGRRLLRLPTLDRPVDVVVDTRGVPHIYADTELDGYRALGYLVARDRLFQLELETRAAEGTLTELVGPSALPLDRSSRRFGFGRMIERATASADHASLAYRSMVAYAEGINAWIDRLRPEDRPLEYRLLGVAPRRWRVDDPYRLLARMALTLAFNDASLVKARAAGLVGQAAADALFPVNAPIQEPIQPNPIDVPRFAWSTIPPPGPADSSLRSLTADAIGLALGRAGVERNEVLGSNNWAVGPARSATRHPLLAGDPHLELTLPSIWYQAHLVVRGQFAVTGVTLPGAPWVIIGFNRKVAWSLTNTGSDVNDFYRETVDDSLAPSRYRLDAGWKPLESRIETYRSPEGTVLRIDTVRFTHRGPLWNVGREWLSMAWTVYDGKDGGPQFAALPRVGSAREFLETTSGYPTPAQNMIVADQVGSIAIRSTGRYPIRPGDGRGDWIQDGSSSAADWVGSLPLADYPQAVDPPRGYLSSANQQPVDPLVNSHYLGANWYSPWRALRINALLRADSAVTVDAMRRYQTDPGSARADLFVPFLLGQTSDSGRVRRAPADVIEARRLLSEWDRRYDRDNRRAVLFELVMAELGRLTWDELAGPNGERAESPIRPTEMILLELMQDSTNAWWDRRSTSAIEHRDDVIELALTRALTAAKAKYGDPGGAGWRWGNVHTANIYHVLRVPALSALGLAVNGGPSTLSPSSGAGTDGPSWRMVVELGPEVVGWGIYPGGQSGNPASPHYLDQLAGWLGGRLDSLITPGAPDSIPADRVESRLRLEPGR